MYCSIRDDGTNATHAACAEAKLAIMQYANGEEECNPRSVC